MIFMAFRGVQVAMYRPACMCTCLVKVCLYMNVGGTVMGPQSYIYTREDR